MTWTGFSPQGELLVVGCKQIGKDLKQQPFFAVYQFRGRNQPQRVETYLVGKPQESGEDSFLNVPAFSADGRRLALVTRRRVFLWDWFPQRNQLASHKAADKRSNFWAVALSPDGRELVTAGSEAVDRPKSAQLAGLHFWGLQRGQLQRRGALLEEANNGEPYQLTFALGGKALFVASTGSYALVDRASKRKIWSWHPPSGGWATLAPDGRHVALSNANGTIYIVRLKEAAKPSTK